MYKLIINDELNFDIDNFLMSNSYDATGSKNSEGELHVYFYVDADKIDQYFQYAGLAINSVNIFDAEENLVYTSVYWNRLQHIGIDYNTDIQRMRVSFILLHILEEENTEEV